LATDDIITVVQQNRLRQYGHVLRKDEVTRSKCMDFEAEGARPRGRPKRTWSEVTEEDCQTKQLCKEDAMDCRKWRNLTEDVAY